MTFATLVPALFAVWLAADPGRLPPRPSDPAPGGAAVARTSRPREGPDRVTGSGRTDRRDEALEAIDPEAEESDLSSILHASARAAFGPENPPPYRRSQRLPGSAHATPHYLIASRLNC